MRPACASAKEKVFYERNLEGLCRCKKSKAETEKMLIINNIGAV